MARPPVLLVYRALGLGDLLTAVPALWALAERFPGHRRILATSVWLEPLALHIGAVDEILAARELAPLAWSGGPPDVAVNLHGRGPQSHGVVLATRPRSLIAFRHPAVAESRGLPAWRPDEHEVHRWCRLLERCGIPADPKRLCIPAPTHSPEEARGATLIHPGAGSPARRWPPERWAAVARFELQHGRDVIVTGGPDEAALGADVARRAKLPASRVYAGRTGVMELVALVAGAGRVVCGDTGVAHLATALRKQSVVLFGPTSPAWWGPLIDRDRHATLWAGATGRPNARRIDPGLLALSVTDVLDQLARLDEEAAGHQAALVGGGQR